MKAFIHSIQSLQKGKHHKIQVKFEFRDQLLNLTELWPFLLRFWQKFGDRSITFERIHQFHTKFTEGLSIIIYRSSSNLKIIRKILTELWFFFTEV